MGGGGCRHGVIKTDRALFYGVFIRSCRGFRRGGIRNRQ